MNALVKKEIAFYLNNPLGYIALIVFGAFANFMCAKDIFLYGVASMRTFFDIAPWLLMIFVPALGMRILSEERKNGTLDVLLSLPISESQIVIAKWLALCILTTIGLALTLSLPISLWVLTGQAGGHIYLPEIMTGYVGLILCSAFFSAIVLFYSSLTSNQIVSFLISTLTLFFLIVFAGDFVSHLTSGAVQDVLNYISPVTHLRGFSKGVIELRAIYYFLSATVTGLFLTKVILEKRS